MAIPDMANRGQAKLTRKQAQMASSWSAARSRMVQGFGAVGFGPTRVGNFNAGIQAATHRSDPAKWARNWAAKKIGSLGRNLQWITGLIRGKLNHLWHANPELSGERSPKCVEAIHPAPRPGEEMVQAPAKAGGP